MHRDVAGIISNNTPEVGGLLGKDTATVDKVKGDLNLVQSAVKSACKEGVSVTTQFSNSIYLSLGTIGSHANHAKNNPLGNVLKDINTANNKAVLSNARLYEWPKLK